MQNKFFKKVIRSYSENHTLPHKFWNYYNSIWYINHYEGAILMTLICKTATKITPLVGCWFVPWIVFAALCECGAREWGRQTARLQELILPLKYDSLTKDFGFEHCEQCVALFTSVIH